MTIQSDLEAARQVFVARLDAANADFRRISSTDIAGATKYMSLQLIALTALSGALITAVSDIADRLDRLDPK